MFKIEFVGNKHTNKSSRNGNIPTVIVNHISSGTMRSMDSWFTTPSNKVSSAHFGISKEGKIHQYVKIEDMAWHAGLKMDGIKFSTAPIVKEKDINPNLYSIGIEHEGTDGDLTEKQLEASIWLHKFLASEVERIYKVKFKLDKKHVIGHFQVDPRRKPNCPGPKFPWTKLYDGLIETVKSEKKEGVSVSAKKQAFIDLVLAGAREVQEQTGMFASVTIAQAIHETGWGRSTPKDKDTGTESYNLFGRKANGSDPFVTSKTWEVYGGKRVEIFAKFKKFNSYTESVLDRCSFLKLSYYKKACSADNPFDACDFLTRTGVFGSNGREIGYATDPKYSERLKQIIRDNNLTQYDLPKNAVTPTKNNTEGDDEMELREEIEKLKKELAEIKELLEGENVGTDEWAKEGKSFVKNNGISTADNGKRLATRQEIWIMLQRYFAKFK